MAKVTKKPVYDTSKNYQWKRDDVFELSGAEFNQLVNYFSKEIYVGVNSINDTVNCHSFLQEILKNSVEAGIATIKEDEPLVPEETSDAKEKTKAK